MTIRQRGKNSYRIEQMVDGKRYSVTVDHKPKKAEAQSLIEAQIRKNVKSVGNMKLTDACVAYNNAKDNIVSPSTIMGYESIIRNIPEKFANSYIRSFTSATLQELSNEWAKTNAPKTVKNRVGYIYTVLKFHDLELKQPTTPQNIKEPPYIPSVEEVSMILDYLEPTQYWVGMLLGALALRRSEILALTLDDLNDGILTVNKAMVPSNTKADGYVIKTTKTAASIRRIPLPDIIIDRIYEQGYIYKGEPGGLYKALKRAQRDLNIRSFPFHKLRHFFVSYGYHKGFKFKQLQEFGGWADNSRVMNDVYAHAMDMENAKKEMSNMIGSLGQSKKITPEITPTQSEPQ